MTDQIFIRELRIETVIGAHAWERSIRQTVVIDLELATDCQRASRYDELDDALDYQKICLCLTDWVEKSEFQLIESLAQYCAEQLLRHFDITWLRLRLSKPKAIANSRTVGVVLERQRN